MTKRTEALSAAYQQLIRDHGKNITEEQFVCYALDAMQKLDAANTPPTGLITENLDPNDPSDQQFLFHVEGLDTKDD